MLPSSAQNARLPEVIWKPVVAAAEAKASRQVFSERLTEMQNLSAAASERLVPQPIPSTFDRLALMAAWVEEKKTPGRQIIVTAGERSLPL